jgi:hypothetical protein
MNNAVHLINTPPAKTLRMRARVGHLLPLNLARRLALPLFLLCGVVLARPCAATPLQWDLTGSLNTARHLHTATLLPNGKVLVAGGFDTSNSLASAELYDAATGAWTPTANLITSRADHTATLLGNGLVLVAGGSSNFTATNAAELYDPATDTWTSTGNLNVARHTHLAVLLPSGMVLVAGGEDSSNRRLKSAELYNPATGTWTLTGSLITARYFLTGASTLLADGRVLLEGGYGDHALPLASAEVYNPATGTWSVTGSINTARGNHTTTLLPDGKVLVAGGEDTNFTPLGSAELYDPASGTWSFTGSLMVQHELHTATLLPNGTVLVASGSSFAGYTTDAELYDPATGAWSTTGSLNTARTHTATLLPNGMVLAAAGSGAAGILNSAELYDPGMAVIATTASGRGSIAGQGDQATFNFHASQSGDRPSGSLSFSDPAAGISITKAKVRTLTFNGNSADLGGNARLGDGTRVTYSISVTDNSSDGSSDTFTISLSNGYSAGVTLTSGDIQIQ